MVVVTMHGRDSGGLRVRVLSGLSEGLVRRRFEALVGRNRGSSVCRTLMRRMNRWCSRGNDREITRAPSSYGFVCSAVYYDEECSLFAIRSLEQ